jgi:transketolase
MNYEETMLALCERDDRVVVMTAENRSAIRNLPPKIGDRFLDVGICEQTMIGMAAGLALRGRIPVCHALATFLVLRAYEFIRDDIGIPRLPVKLVGSVPGFLSEANGPTHQAIEDVAVLRVIPHMQILCPADDVELPQALAAAVDSPDPCYLRYCLRPAAVEHRTPFRIGEAETLAEGDDVTLLVYGMLLREAAEARAVLEQQGLSVGLVNVRTPKPLDEQTILRAASRSRMLVTIEDHFQTGGLYSALCELLVGNGVGARVLPIALHEKWFVPAMLKDVLEIEGFTGPALARRIAARLAESRS